ncbi:MAG: acyl carrier protein [Phycisphaerae bacterium]
MNTIEETLRCYLTEQCLIDFDDGVTVESNLFKLGLLDSFGYLELIGFLEREFDIRFTDEELSASALTSLSSMVASVAEKTNEKQLQA